MVRPITSTVYIKSKVATIFVESPAEEVWWHAFSEKNTKYMTIVKMIRMAATTSPDPERALVQIFSIPRRPTLVNFPVLLTYWFLSADFLLPLFALQALPSTFIGFLWAPLSPLWALLSPLSPPELPFTLWPPLSPFEPLWVSLNPLSSFGLLWAPLGPFEPSFHTFELLSLKMGY